MYLGYHQYQLHFDLLGLALLLSVAVCSLCAVLLFLRRKWVSAIIVSASALALSVCQVYRGAMVPDSAWLAMLGAIESVTGAEREARVTDLRSRWRHQTMRMGDWYVVSAKWKVCHTLWTQEGCSLPSPSEQAAGVAREILDQLARNAPVSMLSR